MLNIILFQLLETYHTSRWCLGNVLFFEVSSDSGACTPTEQIYLTLNYVTYAHKILKQTV